VTAVLPDGLFSNQKSKFGLNLEGPSREDVGIFYVHLIFVPILWPFVIFMDISYISWIFGIVFPFWYVVARKIWQPWVTVL
jgi:hypothetical protein